MKKFMLGLLVTSIFFTTDISCAIKGKVTGNTYTSPGNVFKMEIPNKFNVKQLIDDHSHDGATIVGFVNDYGNNIRIEAYNLPKEIANELKQHENKEQFLSAMEDLFTLILEDHKGQSLKIIRKNYLYDETFGNAFLRVVQIREGSGMVCVENGKTCDAKLGFLMTLSNEHIILVVIQASPVNDVVSEIIKKHSKSSVNFNPIDDLSEQLIGVRRSLKFPV